jgi:hypothetical protein
MMLWLPRGMGYEYMGISLQGKVTAEGIPPAAVFGFSLLVVFLILAAQYESWTLPSGVLFGTAIDVFGAVGALWLHRFEAGRLRPDRARDDDRPRRQERHSHRRVLQGGVRARQAAPRRPPSPGRACGSAPSLMTAVAFIFGVLPS